jgi:hypothetical protein
MNRILELFTHRIIVLLALVIFVGPVFYFHLDERIALFLIGLVFAMSGSGSFIVVRKEKGSFFKGVGCFIGGLALSTGVLCMTFAVIFFLTGTRLDVSR